MTEKDIKKLSLEEINKKFEDLIEIKMSKEQFERWILGWLDKEKFVKDSLTWDSEIKAEILRQYKELI